MTTEAWRFRNGGIQARREAERLQPENERLRRELGRV